LLWNRWPDSIGISGRFASESMAALGRNTQYSHSAVDALDDERVFSVVSAFELSLYMCIYLYDNSALQIFIETLWARVWAQKWARNLKW